MDNGALAALEQALQKHTKGLAEQNRLIETNQAIFWRWCISAQRTDVESSIVRRMADDGLGIVFHFPDALANRGMVVRCQLSILPGEPPQSNTTFAFAWTDDDPEAIMVTQTVRGIMQPGCRKAVTEFTQAALEYRLIEWINSTLTAARNSRFHHPA